ncbi:cytochrome c oxidase subunit II [Marinobacteraceae bacterium S3BR75-40.1]
MSVQALRAGTLAVAGLTPLSAQAAWELNMPSGVTEMSQDIYGLHMTILGICVVIGIVVFGAMFWSILAHRKSKGAKPAHFHESTTVEILWTLIPFLILVGMAIPATATLLDMYNTDKADVRVKITGYQWKWHYQYLDDDFGFFSNIATAQDEIDNLSPKSEHYLRDVDEPLVIPVGKKVEFLMTSNDVIHSWWVPDLGVKKDAIPGFVNKAWAKVEEPGVYRGQCAELCGRLHGFMPIVVKAVPQDEYKTFVAKRQEAAEKERMLTEKDWSRDELVERGEKVYASNCAACHQPDGNGMPPSFPALNGSAVATGDPQEHMNTVVNGRSGTAMQAFGKQLSEVDLAAVITYERNAWGNKTGDKVTPQQIVEFMKEE